MRVVAVLSVLLAYLTACSNRPDAPVNSPHDSASHAPAEAPIATKLTVSEHGIGALRVGMTPGEANAALGGALTLATSNSASCAYANWNGAPEGVHVMFEGGHLVRIEVRSGAMETADGARIGDSEEKIDGLYAGRVALQPAKYTAGHYLVVTPSAAADSAYRFVFETENKIVTRYRAGIRPQVEYVEGCG